MRRRALTVLVLLAAPARAQDAVEQAATECLAALRKGDQKALAVLATRDDPDPWLVAEELVRRAAPDAALSFARAAPRPAVEELPDYIGQRDAAADTVTKYTELTSRGEALRKEARLEASAQAHQEAAAIAERLGWPTGAARALLETGASHYRRGDYRAALPARSRALEIVRSLGDRAGEARALVAVGEVQMRVADYSAGRESLEAGVAIFEAIGDRASAARGHNAMGLLNVSLGAYRLAQTHQENALRLFREIGDRAAAAVALNDIGVTYAIRDDYPTALEYFEKAYAEAKSGGDLKYEAYACANMGQLHGLLADHARALAYQTRALAMFREVDAEASVARTLASIAGTRRALGDHEQAVADYERALKTFRKLGARRDIVRVLGHLGRSHVVLGNHARAMARQKEVLRLSQEIGDRVSEAQGLNDIGAVLLARGEPTAAVSRIDAALKIVRKLDTHVVFDSLHLMAEARLALDQPRQAIESARAAARMVSRFVGGLGDEQAARAGTQFVSVYETGTRAALAQDDVAAACFFLETGRAGALRESLGSADALRAVLLPDDLARAEAAAQAREHDAAGAVRTALRAGKVKDIARAKQDLEAARTAMEEIVARIQRLAKAGAAIRYPEVDELEVLQTHLTPGQALVLYGLTAPVAVAVVLEPARARLVTLAPTAAVEAAAAAFRPHDQAVAPEPALREFRRLVAEPLRLDPATREVLVSPTGRLALLPFALLFPDHRVAYVPSGTTLGLLKPHRGRRGKDVLALGDPDYGATVKTTAHAVHRDSPLVPLPGSRSEVLAITKHVLLGKDATERGLARRLGERRRWRAVHFACHGQIRPDRPMLSALALAADEEHDGFLTCLDVLRLRIPADLVVLSACETGRGKIYKTEGIVGLTRAFMFAGAPRVICSLWKVDDAATRALMVKFYELWNPKEGPGLSASAALRKAQDFVRSHEKWRHPYYWAAWQLSGLPD